MSMKVYFSFTNRQKRNVCHVKIIGYIMMQYNISKKYIFHTGLSLYYAYMHIQCILYTQAQKKLITFWWGTRTTILQK